MKTVSLLLAGLTALFLLSACGNGSVSAPQAPAAPAPAAEIPATPENATLPDESAGVANPAAENCVRLGGTLEIRTSKAGQYGVCLFEDNRQCEEWALFRGQCPAGGVKVTGFENDAQVYCAITGGTVEGVGTPVPMCKRIDGTYCNAQANLDGQCPDPNDPNPNAGNVEADGASAGLPTFGDTDAERIAMLRSFIGYLESGDVERATGSYLPSIRERERTKLQGLGADGMRAVAADMRTAVLEKVENEIATYTISMYSAFAKKQIDVTFELIREDGVWMVISL